MPIVKISDDLDMHYTVDDFTVPWETPETVVMVHGLAESGEAFRGWVPWFSRKYRVIRIDLRGYGRSTAMAADYEWRFDRLVEDLIGLFDALSLDKVHLIGAKIGGTIAMRLGALHSDRLLSLAAVGAPAQLLILKEPAAGWIEQIKSDGVLNWVAATQEGRMGTAMPPEGIEWWNHEMAKTEASTLLGFLRMVPTVDVRPCLPDINVPAIVITPSGSGLGSADEMRAWQETIPNSSLMVIDSDSYHAAAADPDLCAEAVRDFIAGVKQV